MSGDAEYENDARQMALGVISSTEDIDAYLHRQRMERLYKEARNIDLALLINADQEINWPVRRYFSIKDRSLALALIDVFTEKGWKAEQHKLWIFPIIVLSVRR